MSNTNPRRAQRVRIYVNESDHAGGALLATQIVEFLRKRNAAGVTVLRGVSGFGSSGRVHTLQIVDLAADLPVLVEWIDEESLVERLLPELLGMVDAGLVTVDPTTIVLRASTSVRDVSSEYTAATAMTSNPLFVSGALPVRQVVGRMNERGLRAVPVVEDDAPIGMITSGDLIERAGLAVSLARAAGLKPSEPPWEQTGPVSVAARDVMTTPITTVRADTTLSQVAATMVQRNLKRLPVVDEQGKLVGIVSRVDLLRTVVHVPSSGQAERVVAPLDVDLQLEHVMRRDVPTVLPSAEVPEVIEALIATRLRLAFVIDSSRHVLGLVTETELLQRVTPSLRRNALVALMRKMPFFRPAQNELESERHADAKTAEQLMTTNFERATPTTPLKAAIGAMIGGAHKVVAVVDDRDCLVGVIDRADVLRALLRSMPTA